MKSQLVSIVMTDGQDPDVLINEIHHIRDELVGMGEILNDNTLLIIVLEVLIDGYLK